MTNFANILDAPFLRAWEERQASPVEAVPTPLAPRHQFCGVAGGRVWLARGCGGTTGRRRGRTRPGLTASMGWSQRQEAWMSSARLNMGIKTVKTEGVFSIVT